MLLERGRSYLLVCNVNLSFVFFFQAEDGIRDGHVTGVQTCALPISAVGRHQGAALALLALFAQPSPLLQSNPTWRPRRQSRALAGAADPDYLNDQNFQYTC